MSDPQAIKKWARAFLIAQAELEAFDTTWAGSWFRSKDHERSQLVATAAQAKLEYVKATLAEPSSSKGQPIATPEEARQAYAKHRSERKAADALGLSKTHLRRKRLQP